MANTLPLVIEMGALPPSVRWTPQQLADSIAESLRVTTQQSFALFVTGSTEPSSNVGPWLKNGVEWYVWSDNSGDYVPITIAQESLGYFIGEATPDPTVYQFWIRTTAGGSPLGISIYYSGSWVDVYAAQLASYATIAAMNAAIAAGDAATLASANAYTNAQIAGIPASNAGRGVFSAQPSVQQDVVFGGAGNQTGVVTLGQENFDPDNQFSANRFTAIADGYYQFNGVLQVTTTGGSPTDLDIQGSFLKNGAAVEGFNNTPGPDTTNGQSVAGSCVLFLSAGQYVELGFNFTTDAAVTVQINGAYTRLSGFRVR